MFVIFAYDYENRMMAVPAAFQTEDDAWTAVTELMQQPNHPKMAWVKKGVVPDGHLDRNCHSGSQS